jgi:hypothetical protein
MEYNQQPNYDNKDPRRESNKNYNNNNNNKNNLVVSLFVLSTVSTITTISITSSCSKSSFVLFDRSIDRIVGLIQSYDVVDCWLYVPSLRYWYLSAHHPFYTYLEVLSGRRRERITYRLSRITAARWKII